MKFWQETFGQAQSKWQLAGWLLAFAFLVLALVLDKAASTIFALFFLAGLWLLIRRRVEKPDSQMRLVLLAFAAYFAVGVLCFFLGEEQTRLGEKILGRDIRFLAAVVAYIAIAPLMMPRSLIVYASALGGIATGAVALGEVLLAEHTSYRAGGETISILFGHLAASLAAVNMSLFLCEGKRVRYVAAIGFAGATYGIFLSGTRGALVALLLISIWLVISEIVRCRFGWKRVLLLGVVAGMVMLLPHIRDSVSSRAAVGIEEISQLLNGRERTNSFDWPRVPACYNDKAFLQWLVDNSLTGGKGDLVIEIAEFDDTWEPAAVNCTDAYRVILRNRSKQDYAWVHFPPRDIPPNVAIAGRLLVKGQGYVGLDAAPPETRTRVNANEPVLISLAVPKKHNTRIEFALGRQQQLEFVPMLTYESEYRFLPFLSSAGLRILMWQTAMDAFVDAPLFGHGTGTFPDVMRQRAREGRAPWQLVELDHAHNEILTIAAERGIVGLLTLFAVYAAPFWLFWRRRDVFGVAGMAFVASIFLSGLTETIFNHSLGITYYCMMVLLLATAAREPGTAGVNS